MSFQSYMEAAIKEIDQEINQWLPPSQEYPEVLTESMRYSLFAKGKRLRPILLLATAEALCGKRREFLPAACAIEMIHTYSLIHDDLPAMDDDDLRRGIPTNHKVYGEANAILAGDALLTYAFYLIASMKIEMEHAEAVQLELIRELSEAAGFRGMIRGQVADLLNEGKHASKEMLEFIHQNKTGAMLQAAVRMGARLGGASQHQLDALTRYASAIGLAFQIVDDILDVEGNTEVMGKSVGSDAALDKSTFVSLYGLEESKVKARELAAVAEDYLKQAELADSSRLMQVASFVVERVW